MRSSVFLFCMSTAALVLGACKDEPDDIPECPEGGSGGSGGDACGDPVTPPAVPTCADPEFDGMPSETPTEYQCEGRAGGAIVYNHKLFEFGEFMAGGPGAIELTPPQVEFPSMGNTVSACCYGSPSQSQVEDGACQSDCGRAACNRILDGLRNSVADPMSDPSDGDCDDLPTEEAANDCKSNIRNSIMSWIDQIEINYEQCVAAAVNNSNSMLLYNDPAVAFADSKKLELANWGCSIDDWGCLHDAEVRPFCEIDGHTVASSCEMAGNDRDPAADGGLDDTGDGDGGGGGVAPFGDVGALVSCSPSTVCDVEQELLDAVQVNFQVFYEEGVELVFTSTGLKITGLDSGEDSEELFDAFSVQNDDVITHVNSTALTSWSNVLSVIDDIDTTSVWYVTVKRPLGGSFWATYNYTISRVALGQKAPGTVDALANSVDPEDASQGSCACQASDGEESPFVLGAFFFGVVARRRRRVLS